VADQADEPQWVVLDHICRACFGRLLKSTDRDGTIVIKCADCETEAYERVENLCCCGAKLRNGRRAGLKCQRNPAPGAEQPAQIVVGYVG
jgi:hypothetical protein